MAKETRVIIGVDTHIRNCNFFAIEEVSGEILGADHFDTTATNFIKNVSQFPKPRVVVIEQGPMSGWIERILDPFVEKVVVAETKQNSWIARDPNKNDDIDGEKLARLYIGGYIGEIKSRSVDKAELISLVIHYHSLINQIVRIKNQISAKFRQNGKRIKGNYEGDRIEKNVIYLDHNKAMIYVVRNYHAELELFKKQLGDTVNNMQKMSYKFPEIFMLRKFSGIGFVGSVTLSALIDVPERFPTVKKIWIYCGYGLDRQKSGSNPGKPRITRRGNRMVKYVIMNAVHNIISVCKNTAYKDWYLSEIQLGKDPKKVKARLARKLIKDVWIEWRRFNEIRLKDVA